MHIITNGIVTVQSSEAIYLQYIIDNCTQKINRKYNVLKYVENRVEKMICLAVTQTLFQTDKIHSANARLVRYTNSNKFTIPHRVSVIKLFQLFDTIFLRYNRKHKDGTII